MLIDIAFIVLSFMLFGVALVGLTHFTQLRRLRKRISVSGNSVVAWLLGAQKPFPRQWSYGSVGYSEEQGTYWKPYKSNEPLALLVETAQLVEERPVGRNTVQMEFSHSDDSFSVRVFGDELSAAKSVLFRTEPEKVEVPVPFTGGHFAASLMNLIGTSWKVASFRLFVSAAFSIMVAYELANALSHYLKSGW